MSNQLVVCLLLAFLLRTFDACAEKPEELELNCEVLDKLYALWSASRYGEDPSREKCAWMVRNSDGGCAMEVWPASRRWKMEVWKGVVPANMIAQAHTHPVDTDPRPSVKDRAFSQNVNAPLYTISRRGIWMVSPTGEVKKLAGQNWHENLYKKECKPLAQ
jgi:hypothetical protein